MKSLVQAVAFLIFVLALPAGAASNLTLARDQTKSELKENVSYYQGTRAEPAYDSTWENAVVKLSGPNGFCSGTLIADHWILTAQHCLLGQAAATVCFNSSADGVDRCVPVDRQVGNPNYEKYHKQMSDLDQAYLREVLRMQFAGATNQQILAYAEPYREHNLQLTRAYPLQDWALLHFSLTRPNGIRPLSLVTAADVQVGVSAMALGYPGKPLEMGSSYIAPAGRLARMKGERCHIRDLEMTTGDQIYADCPVTSGMSGGPFVIHVNGAWKVAGVTSGEFEDILQHKATGQAWTFAYSSYWVNITKYLDQVERVIGQ